ncbi:GNAT family N-acetyltransferase [Bacillus spongiae]|uniref:GNAT family N-acetyltransferase n=1 Tax=Bacillus spongiae TaxID=2683610 RepID=A0ABU8HJ03_9BACI
MCSEEEERLGTVILFKHQPAGFFVLHGWNVVKVYSTNEKAKLLRAYFINPAYQGRGIAKQSLEYLSEFINVPFPR